MRIISGQFKSFSLQGNKELKIRPSTDRLKETLFNILKDKVLGSNFADFFSGYGGIGIEALSRGAQNVMFVDNNYKCINTIKQNVSRLIEAFPHIKISYIDQTQYKLSKEYQQYAIVRQEVSLFIEEIYKKNYKFDIIFIDPPYRSNLVEKCLFKISKYDILKNSGWIIVEAKKNKVLDEKFDSLKKFMEKTYGKNKLLFYKK